MNTSSTALWPSTHGRGLYGCWRTRSSTASAYRWARSEFEYNDADATLTSEFTRGQTHGVWAYKVSGDTMTGTLVILPDKTLGRRVSVRRVSEDQVPKAPALEEYVSVVRQCW